jgi:hypothetical protein
MRLRSSLLAALFAASLAGPAYAQGQDVDEANKKQARDLGQEGQKELDAHNFARSEELFTKAWQLYPYPPTLTLGIARAQAAQGKVVAATENYNKIIREWGNKKDAPPAFAEAVKAAQAEVDATQTRIASATIVVEGAKNPQVLLDDKPLPPAALGFKRGIDPGKHVIKVTATSEGMKPVETSFTVPEGGSVIPRIKLEKDTSAPIVKQPEEQKPEPATSEAKTQETQPGKSAPNRTPAYVALGIGGAGLLVGTITGVIAIGKAGDLKNKCNSDKQCDPSLQSDVDSYKSIGGISTIAFIVGGVGVATGAVLYLTAAPKKEAPTAAWISPYVSGTGGGVTGRF